MVPIIRKSRLAPCNNDRLFKTRAAERDLHETYWHR
jgi:hypothetical protein